MHRLAPRRALSALTASLLAATPVGAEGRTPPTGGALAAPEALALRAPFPCGTAFRVSCGYGPSCSGYHSGTANTGSSNDYYALDLVRADSGSGRDKPITAVAAGAVRYAGWATGGWASYGQIVLLEHDIGDGHRYSSLYAHLQRVSVQQGQRVAAGEALGTMGGSANGVYDGFATHLHFAIYRDAKLDGGPYGGQAVVPEPLGGAHDLTKDLTLTATCDASSPPASEPPQPEDPGPLSLPAPSPAPAAGEPAVAEDGELFGAGSPQVRGAPRAYGGCSATPASGRSGASLGVLLALGAVGARRRRRRR